VQRPVLNDASFAEENGLIHTVFSKSEATLVKTTYADKGARAAFLAFILLVTAAAVVSAQESGQPRNSEATAADKWYSDAPYAKLKERYEVLVSGKPDGLAALNEECDMAMCLCGEYFPGWTDAFGKSDKGKDQFNKAFALYEHIVKSYPKNEYKVLLAKAQMAGLWLNLKRDAKGAARLYMEVFATPTSSVTDSTEPTRNKPLPVEQKSTTALPLDQIDDPLKLSTKPVERKAGTQVQMDFEQLIKDQLRARVIELCKAAGSDESIFLFNEIETRCSQTDPELCKMASSANTDAVASDLLDKPEEAPRYWAVGTPITGEIAAHDAPAGEPVFLDSNMTAFNAYGIGKFPCPYSKATEPDMLIYYWMKAGEKGEQSGAWRSPTSNKAATLQAPPNAGRIELVLAVDDLPLPMTSRVGKPVGTRKEDPVVKRCKINVTASSPHTETSADNATGGGAAKASSPTIEAVPSALNLFMAIDGTAVEAEVAIQSKSSQEPIGIRRIALSPELKCARLSSMKRTPNGWKIGVRLQATDNADAAGALLVSFADKTLPDVTVPITFKPLARSSVEPSKVFFGIVKPGQSATKTVSIRTRPTDNISELMLAPPADAAGLKASLQQDKQDKNLFTVTLTWTPEAGQQKMLQHVCLKGVRDGKVVELIDIPCLGLQSGVGETREPGGSR
jgi:hypothetical protein